ncbi:unnamed protein product [Urochloa decumbens]|uniref:Peptidase A1 domain-containing protein n=1 Tax=Urochloa decumbens TaxID=240449 RepID=A0ABC9D5G7_9POAL
MSLRSSTSSSSPVLPLLVLSLLLLSGDASSKPIVTPITKDDSTGLYTIPVKNGAPLVLDLASPLIWSPCQSPHRTFPCNSSICTVAKRNRPASCGGASSAGQPGSGDPNCACAAFAYNPASGQCGSGDLTAVPLSANTTDGNNPLSPVTFSAYATCAPDALLASLPAGAAGVAGLSRQPLSLPSLVASRLKVAKEFALCLPGGGGQTGAAIFGGGPFVLRAAAPEPMDLAGDIRQNPLPLLKNPKNSGAYYFGVHGIAFNQEQLNLPAGAFELDRRQGTGGVVFSTTTRFTTLRSDIYSALINAFDAVTRNVPRRKPVPPLQLCYEASAFPMTFVGPAVPNIDLMLDGGRNWTLPGGNSIVQTDSATVCFAFDSMGPEQAAAFNSPAVIFGAYQMEDSLILFDLEKGTFGTSGLLPARRTNCGNFNFAMGSS